MRLLLGVADFGEREEKLLCRQAEEVGITITDCERRYTKTGIIQYLDKYPDTNVTIFSEAVESMNPFSDVDYELLSERYEQVRMIPILMNERRGTEYVRDIFHAGIYNAVFADDADISTVLHLMKSGRSRKEAKLYYKLDEVDDLDTAANIDRCVRTICEAADENTLVEYVTHIHNMLNAEEFQEVLLKLDTNRLDMMRNISDISAFIPESMPETVSDAKNGVWSSLAGVFSTARVSMKTESRTLESIHQPDPANDQLRMNAVSADDLYEIISNVIVGFVGNQRRSGVTHQAITAAHFLAAYGYCVALADCSARGGKSLSSFETIEKYRDTEMLSADSFSYLGVDYYKNMNVDSLNNIFSSEKKYHFVIIDYGTFSPYVKTDIGRCTIKCAVCGSMPWEVNQLCAFVNDTRHLSDQMVYLIRGVAPEARDKQTWISELVTNYLFADVQEDPFDGSCYPALASLFDKYVKGLPTHDIGKNQKGSRDTVIPTMTGNAGEVSSGDKQIFMQGLFHKRKGKNSKKEFDRERERGFFAQSHVQKPVTGCWFVSELKHGAGCSYISAVIANLLATRTDRVCMITDDEYLKEYVADNVQLYMWDGAVDAVFSTYNTVVIDGGVYSELPADRRREMTRAAHKYMICRSNDEYMRVLAEHVASDEAASSKWAYIFNQIPPSDHVKIKRLMSSYDICFLQGCDARCMTKEVKKSFSGII